MKPNDRKLTLRQIANAVLIVLSFAALVDLLIVGIHTAGARIFQLSIVALVPTGFLFVATTDWTQPLRTVRRLAFLAPMVVLTLVAAYYLERHFYPAHFPMHYR
jgi:hypothetical protein